MMKLFKLFVLILFISQSNILLANGLAVGFVYDDINNNHIKDKNEPGVENVGVSNGIDVVLTNNDGRYELPVSEDAIIFVIKPSDYSFPVNSLNQPQFYYIHKPKGSPKLRYAGVAPTGKLPKSIDFPLKKIVSSDFFSIAVFSDPQIFSVLNSKYYGKDIIDSFINSGINADFGLTLGDMVNDDLDLLPALNKETARLGVPWFHCTGNHDINFDIDDYRHSDETFELNYGPTTYSFNHGKVHFVVLNDIIYPNQSTKHKYVGGFREEQLKFLINSLKFVPKDHLIVLLMHIPIKNETQWGITFLEESRLKLFEILKGYQHTLSLSGHTHAQNHSFFTSKDGWQNDGYHHHYNVGTASGDWWSGEPKDNGVPISVMRDGTPNGFNVITFSGNQYRYEYISASKPQNYKMRLYAPKTVKANIYNGGDLYINFFQGSEKDIVEFSVNGGLWEPMQYTVEFDPYICAKRYIWDTSEPMPIGNRPSAPDYCTHLWKARIKTNIPIGTNIIKVRVSDMFGRIYQDEISFETIISDAKN